MWCAFFVSAAARADLFVPAGGVTSLAGGIVDLACTDVTVAGRLNVDTGSLRNVRNVTILAGAVLDGGTGLIEVGGNWSNSGSFVAGTGTVNFRDLCSVASATIAGSTAFSTASFVTGSGKNYLFAVSATQTVTSLLQIAGTQASPIQFRSTAPGQVGFVNLQNGGAQQIQHVGVTDVWATGQWLAPLLTNEGGGGNDYGWFGGGGGGSVTQVPVMDDVALAVLALLLAVTGAWLARRRANPGGTSGEP